MIIASELHEGMSVRIDGQIYRVQGVDSKAGAAKMSGVVKTKLINVHTGHLCEPHFRPQEKIDVVELERRVMQFLYASGSNYTFMHPETFEQIDIPEALIGPAAGFLHPGEELTVEFFAGQAISVAIPNVAEMRVSSTPPPSRSQQESTWKHATLENGLTVRVPLFIAPGETVRVDLKTGRYLERAHQDHKRSA